MQISFRENAVLSLVCGSRDRHLRLLEEVTGVSISPRGNLLALSGTPQAVKSTAKALGRLYSLAQENARIEDTDVNAALKAVSGGEADEPLGNLGKTLMVGKRRIVAAGSGQEALLSALENSRLVFALGPAGTGKTFLAVAYGLHLLEKGGTERMVLSRPAVEAGERLGFLPGDAAEKVNPYLRPVYDALGSLLPPRKLSGYLANGTIEIAPLAFMRGRTLNDCFVILDEAQNTTPAQLKMALTRLGQNAAMVVAGDPSQVDLPPSAESALRRAARILKRIKRVGVIELNEGDVARSNLVADIVGAYNKAE